MPAVFISYARHDTALALRVAGALRGGGADVWIDQADIPPGQRWDRSIERALDACSTMVVLLTPVSVSSENVMDEVGFALEERKRVIPVLAETCTVPFRLRRLQHVDLRAGGAAAMARLLQAVGLGESQPGCVGPRADETAWRGDVWLSAYDESRRATAAAALAAVTGLPAARADELARAGELSVLVKGLTEDEGRAVEDRLELAGVRTSMTRSSATSRELPSFECQDLWLIAVGPRRIEVMKLIREATGADLPAIRQLIRDVEQGPQPVLRRSLARAEKLKCWLDATGAQSELRPAADPG